MDALYYPKQSIHKILVFDVETTGLLTEDIDRYITQLSFIVYDVDKVKITTVYNKYIDIPRDVHIRPFITEKTGITKELLHTIGVPITIALRDLYAHIQCVDYIVAHNIMFDKSFIEYEVQRNRDLLPDYMVNNYFKNMLDHRDEVSDPYMVTQYNLRRKRQKAKMYCTLAEGVDMCNLPMRLKSNPKQIIPGKKKWPKLTELYYTLFRIHPDEKFMHNSLIDVLFTLRCFLRMRVHKEWSNDHFDNLFHKMIQCSSNKPQYQR